MMTVISFLFQLAFLLTSLVLRVAALLAILVGRLVGALIVLAWRYRPSFPRRVEPDMFDTDSGDSRPPRSPAPKADPAFRPRPLRPRPRR